MKLVIGDHVQIIWRYCPDIYTYQNIAINVCILGPFCQVSLHAINK